MDVRRQYRADGTIEAVELVWRDQLVDDTRLVQYQGLTFTQVVGHRSWLALASAEKAIITTRVSGCLTQAGWVLGGHAASREAAVVCMLNLLLF